jgi:hypothetical protein
VSAPPGDHEAPPGAITLDELITALQRCRDEPGVDGSTLVRVAPEFGGTQDALFASGAAVTYPAGDGWALCTPWVTVQYRREHDALLTQLAGVDRSLYSALRRNGYTVRRLERLSPDPKSRESWHDLADLERVGQIRLLKLVNFFRRHGLEFGWFAAFDEVSADWFMLRDREREPPVAG